MDESATSVLVMGYNGVALEGDSVNFTCSSELVLTGPNSSMCTGSGKWEPDPRRSACHKSHHNNICRSLLDHSDAAQYAAIVINVVMPHMQRLYGYKQTLLCITIIYV